MKPDIKYSDDSRILVRTFSGKVSFIEVMDSWKQLIEDEMISIKTMGILNDFSNADLQMSPENLDQMMDFFQDYPEIFERIKLAAVMTIPGNIILPILANKKYPQYKIQAFSTIEAANDWIRD